MFKQNFGQHAKFMLLAGILASSILVSPARSQTVAAPGSTPSATAPAAGAPYHQPVRTAKRAEAYYGSVWGVEGLRVKAVESGEIIRFSYRIIDPERAKPLHDKKIEPTLVSPEKGVKLVIPSLEKVGQLRQSSTPEAGKSYWMAFSNSGRLIRPGDHVDVIIGQFHAQGLVVE